LRLQAAGTNIENTNYHHDGAETSAFPQKCTDYLSEAVIRARILVHGVISSAVSVAAMMSKIAMPQNTAS